MERSRQSGGRSWRSGPNNQGKPKDYEREQGRREKAVQPREPRAGQSYADLQDQKFKQPRQAPAPREPGPGQSWADIQDQKFKQPKLTLDLGGPVGWRARQAVANDHMYRAALQKFVAQPSGLQVSKDDVREQRHGILTKEYRDVRLKPFDDRSLDDDRGRSRSRGFERD